VTHKQNPDYIIPQREISILIIKAKDALFLNFIFGKELYMFRTDLLSIIRSLDTVFTATGICHTTCSEYSIKTPDDGQ